MITETEMLHTIDRRDKIDERTLSMTARTQLMFLYTFAWLLYCVRIVTPKILGYSPKMKTLFIVREKSSDATNIRYRKSCSYQLKYRYKKVETDGYVIGNTKKTIIYTDVESGLK